MKVYDHMFRLPDFTHIEMWDSCGNFPFPFDPFWWCVIIYNMQRCQWVLEKITETQRRSLWTGGVQGLAVGPRWGRGAKPAYHTHAKPAYHTHVILHWYPVHWATQCSDDTRPPIFGNHRKSACIDSITSRFHLVFLTDGQIFLIFFDGLKHKNTEHFLQIWQNTEFQYKYWRLASL